NGYSHVRRSLFEKMKLRPGSRLPGPPFERTRPVARSTTTVGEELLRVHKNYQPLVAKVPAGMIKGLAHITGGGLIDNLPRVLPKNCDAIIETKSWAVPRIFKLLQEKGHVPASEMYQVFNMGIAMDKRRLGKTDMDVSVLGFGGSEIGYEHASSETVAELLNSALDAGLNVIDTAECYYNSEELVGQTVSDRRKEFYLFTKCGHPHGMESGANWSKDSILKSIERSLDRLKTDRLDLVQLNS